MTRPNDNRSTLNFIQPHFTSIPLIMVNYTDVLKNNNSLQQPSLTAVFVGGTNGIGLGALRAFTKHAESPTIYIIGRSQSNLDSLEVLPPLCTFPLNARSFLTKICPNIPFYTTYNLIAF